MSRSALVEGQAGLGCVAVLLAIVFFIPDLAAQRSRAVEPSFRSASSELVVLPVIVTDRSDQYVGGLRSDQFTVYDNGRPVPIELFSSEDTPVTVGLVIDASGSMEQRQEEVIAASLRFASSSNPNDELFAIRFNDEVRDALQDRRFLRAGDRGDLEQSLRSVRPGGRTALYDALLAALDQLDEGSRPRKVLVLISDGGDNASRGRLEQVLARARRSNAAIYTIGLYEEGDADSNPHLLKKLASTTGGERFVPRSEGALLTACEHIARAIRSGYTIGYVPPNRDSAFHRVRVEVASRDGRKLTARTRPGYFAGS
jgi:VWFA-related protein